MSQENVEVVRDAFEAWRRNDLEAFLSMIGPDVEWQSAQQLANGARGYQGIAGMREFWTIWRSDLVPFDLVTDELRELGDDRVLHLAHIRWPDDEGGTPLGQVVTVRDAKIIRSVGYLSHEQALEAVGLRE